MKIRNIEIHSFAGLKDYYLHFDPGKNLYYGPNERGKSTIIQFIFAMFYGLGDRRGDNMRDRLTPRDGSAMSGTIWFEHESKTYELNRQFGKTKAQDIVELIDLSINKRVELDNPEQVGVEVFGIEKEIFQNTVLIESEKLEIDADSSVNNAIWDNLTNFMVSADSNVTVNTVETRLEDGRNLLQTARSKNKIIPQLEEQVSELEQEKYWREDALNEQAVQQEELEELEESLLSLKSEQANLEIEERILELAEDKKTLDMIERPYESLVAVKNEEKDLRAELPFLEEYIDIDEIDENISNVQIDLRQYEAEQKEFIERREELEETKQKFAEDSTKRQSLNVALFFVVLIIMFFAFSLLDRPVAMVVAGITIAIFGIYIFNIYNSSKKFAEESAATNEELVKDVQAHESMGAEISSTLKELQIESDLGDEDFSDIYAKLDGILDLIQELKYNQRDIETIKNQIASVGYTQAEKEELASHIQTETAVLSKLGYETEDVRYSASEKVNIENRLREIKSSIFNESERVNSLEIELKSRFRDPVSGELQSPFEEIQKIEIKLEEVSEDLANAKLDLEAYDIAKEVFSDSLIEFRKTLLPKLSDSAARYINKISRGRYSDVIIGDDLSLMIKDNYTGNHLEPDKFSSGTRDQIWLSYRLALTDYLSKGSSFPLLLDDIFVNYDDKRTKASLDLLDYWSSDNDRQVILLTHHKHIKDFAVDSESWKVRTIPKSNI